MSILGGLAESTANKQKNNAAYCCSTRKRHIYTSHFPVHNQQRWSLRQLREAKCSGVVVYHAPEMLTTQLDRSLVGTTVQILLAPLELVSENGKGIPNILKYPTSDFGNLVEDGFGLCLLAS